MKATVPLFQILLMTLAVLTGPLFGGCDDALVEASGPPPILWVFDRNQVEHRNTAQTNVDHFFDLWNILEPEVHLQFTPELIDQGVLKQEAFVLKLKQVQKHWAGNLYLRFVAQFCRQIAHFFGHPLMAGDLFLSYLNLTRDPFELDEFSTPVHQFSSMEDKFKAISFATFTSVGDLSSLLQQNQEAMVLSLLFSAMNALSSQLSGSYSAHEMGLIHTQQMSTVFGIPSLQAVRPHQSSTEVEFDSHSLFGGSHLLRMKIGSSSGFAQRPLLLLPHLGFEFPSEFSFLAEIALDGKVIAGYVPVDSSLASELLCKMKIFEVLAFPLLHTGGAYRLATAVQTAFVGSNGRPEPVVHFNHLSDEVFSGQGLLEQSIAHAMMASISLSPPDYLAFSMFQTISALATRPPPGFDLHFDTFERVARKYDLPIWFVANPFLELGVSRAWLKGSMADSRTSKPNYSLWLSVKSEKDAQFMKSNIEGYTEAINLKRLRNETGIMVKHNSTLN